MPLQIRRGTEAERLVMTTPLAQGELLYVTDDQRLYIGNGSTLGGVQITGYTNEDAMDAAAGMFTSGVHTGITFTYGITQDAAGRIDVAVDLTNYNGSISGDLVGSVFSDTSTRLIDGTNGKFNLNGTINGHIIPDDSETYDLGSGSYRFRDLWLSGSSIHLGNALITSSGSAVNLPAGSTVNGIAIGSGTTTGDGVIEGSTYKINIAADDSSLMLNSDLETVTASGGFFGNITGNVTGGVTGDVAGNLTGNVTGNLTGNVTGDVTGDVTGNVTGDVTGNLAGAHQGDLYAADFAKLVDATTKEFTGTLIGSVYADDTTTLLVDSSTGTVTGTVTGDINTSGKNFTVMSTSSGIEFSQVNGESIAILSANVDGTGPNMDTVGVNCSRGTVLAPANTLAGDFVGGITIRGYRDTDPNLWTGAVAMIANWDISANFAGDAPASQLNILTGANGSQNILNFSHKGVLSAPVFKAASYATGSLPSSPEAGWMVFDSDTSQFKGWNGSAWVVLG